MKLELQKVIDERKKTFETISEWVIVVDLLGYIVYANKAALKGTGYKENEMIGKHFREFIPGSELPALLTAQKDLRSFKLDKFQVYAKGKRLVDVEVNSNLIKVNGSAVGAQTIFRDITEKERAQEAYESLFHTVDIGLAIHDLRGRVIKCNTKLLEIFGYDEKEIKSFNFQVGMLSSGEGSYTQPEAFKKIKLAAQGKPQVFMWRAKKKSGDLFWVRVSLQRINLWGKKYVLAVVDDITERHNAELDEKKHEKELEILFKILEQGNQANNMQSLLKTIVDSTLSIMNYKMGGIYLVNDVNKQAEIKYSKGLSEAFLSKTKLVNINEKPYRTVFVERKPIIVSDYSLIEPKHAKRLGIGSLCSIPVFTNHTAIGAINIASAKKHIFSKHNINILLTVGQQAGTLIKRMIAEEKLKKNQEWLKNLFQYSSAATAIISRNGKFIDVNDEWLKLTGYKKEEIVGNSFTNFLPKEEKKRLTGYLSARSAGGKAPFRYEFKFFNNNKEVRNALTQVVFLKDYGVVFASVIDITEQKKAAKELEESKERYYSTLENMLEGCQIISRDWKYLYVNRMAALHGRFEKNKLIGKSMMEVYPDIQKTKMFSVLKKCMKYRVAREMVNEFIYPSGVAGWFELRIMPVPEGICILSHDITDRKTAEKALAESEEKYRTIFSSVNEVIIFLDKKGKIIDVNRQMEKISGYKRSEVINQSIQSISRMFTKSSLLIILKNFAKRIAGENIAPYEVEVIAKDKSILNMEISGAAVKKEGNIIGSLVVMRDLTARRQAEKEFREHADSLARMNKFMINREQKLIEQKTEIARLNGIIQKLGK